MKLIQKIRRRYFNLELKEQLYVIFFVVSASLSVIGLFLGILFQVPFWMNIPHIVIIMMCLFLPMLLNKSISDTTEKIMMVGAVFYLPFVFFTNGGHEGATPIYFVMIIVYYAFHVKGRRLFVSVVALNTYYFVIMLLAYNNPAMIVPYPDEASRFIDYCVAIISVSSVLVIVSYSAFSGYKRERRNVYDLMAELTNQNKALEELSIRDQLTGVFARNYFLDKLAEELELMASDSFVFYVLMVDLDYFKQINDTYGHLFGDEVLRKVANTINANIRSYDIAARYGGEEFIILLTHSAVEKGNEVAERIRASIEALEFREAVKVTVSIGVSINCLGDTAELIIERADEALYKAKKSGRNKTCVWSE